MGSRSLRVILNGGKASGKQIESAVEMVRRHGHTVDIRLTSKTAGAAKLSRQAVEDGIDVVVAGGGDGTVNEVVNGLFAASAEPDVVMAVLPLGSSNDFARSCGTPMRNPGKALLVAACAEPIGIDVGRVNQHYFLNSVVAGLGAEATFRTSETMKRWLGGTAYRLAGTLSALRPGAYPVQLRTSDGVEKTLLSFIAVMNGKWAGGTRIAGRAMLRDGMFDVLSVPAYSMGDLPALLADFRAMPQRNPSFLRYEQREWVEIEALGDLPVSPDGEQLCGTSLRFDILKRRLPFALPEIASI